MLSSALHPTYFAAINNPVIWEQPHGLQQVLSNTAFLLQENHCFIAYKNAESEWELAALSAYPDEWNLPLYTFCTDVLENSQEGLTAIPLANSTVHFWAYHSVGQSYPMAVFAPQNSTQGNSQVAAILDMAFLAALHNIPITAEYIFATSIERAANEKSEAKFKSLVYNISDIITLLSAEGHILYQSSSLKQIMHYEENELVGKTMFDIIHPQDHSKMREAFIATLQKPGSGPIAEIRLLDKTGKYLHIEAQGNNQLHNPLINAVVVNSRDISERKKIEEERQALIDELTRHNNDLKRFSFITSHNLRAPVTNLLAIIELLNEPGISQDTLSELLNGFTVSTHQLQETLNDLTEILIIKNTQHQNLQILALEDSWKNAVASVFSSESITNLDLQANFSEAPQVIFIKTFLDNIFLQLLSNSKKFAQPNIPLRVVVYSAETESDIQLVFSDNGLGFDYENVKDNLFGMYQKFHFANSGKGLGLFLIQSQITALGGRIEVETAINQGTTFTIYFKKHAATQ